MSTSFVSLSAIFIWFFFDFLPTSWIFFSLCHWEFNLEIQFFSNNFSLLFNKNCLPFCFHFPEVEYSSTSLELRISSEIFITDEVLFYFQYMNISQWRPQFKQQSTVPSIGSGFFFREDSHFLCWLVPNIISCWITFRDHHFSFSFFFFWTLVESAPWSSAWCCPCKTNWKNGKNSPSTWTKSIRKVKINRWKHFLNININKLKPTYLLKKKLDETVWNDVHVKKPKLTKIPEIPWKN